MIMMMMLLVMPARAIEYVQCDFLTGPTSQSEALVDEGFHGRAGWLLGFFIFWF